MWQGTVLSIHTASTAGASMVAHQSVRAIAGKGLEGDRYFLGEGFYSWFRGPLREISLIEAEVLERLAHDHHLELVPGETRRNIITQTSCRCDGEEAAPFSTYSSWRITRTNFNGWHTACRRSRATKRK